MAVYPSNPRPTQVPESDGMEEPISRSTIANTSENTFRTVLILAVLIAIIFGILMVIYIVRQNSTSETTTDKVDSQEESEVDEKVLFDNCLDVIWENLLRLNFNQSNPEHLQPIRIKVFNTFRRLTSKYKRDLILFLYEHGLIRTDIPLDQRLNLHGADLNNTIFEDIKLDYLYIPGVIASNSRFHKCQLKKSNFQGSIMDGARFTACSLEGSTFSDASMKHSTFSNDNIVSSINFTNADLYKSTISLDTGGNNSNYILLNTRLSNGSFSAIDSKELINNGGAEQQCDVLQSDHWWIEPGYSSLKVVDKRNNKSCSGMSPATNNSKCYFQANSTSRLIQEIDLNQFSTLIDNNQAEYNVSAYLGCFNSERDDRATVELQFGNKYKNYDNYPKYIMQQGKPFETVSNGSFIPNGIRVVRIMIGADIINSTGVPPSCCGIDNVKFRIMFQKNSTYV